MEEDKHEAPHRGGGEEKAEDEVAVFQVFRVGSLSVPALAALPDLRHRYR